MTSNLNEPAEMLLNEGPAANHWLMLKLAGHESESAGNRRESPHRARGRGCAGQSGHHVRRFELLERPADSFRLGTAKLIKRIDIAWPSGKKQRLENVEAD